MPQDVGGVKHVAKVMHLLAMGRVIEVILAVGVCYASRVPAHNVEGGASVEPGLAVPLDLREDDDTRQLSQPALTAATFPGLHTSCCHSAYKREGLGTRLHWGRPGNKATLGKAWERDYTGEGLGMRLHWGRPGNKATLGKAWE